ncbi:MAG: hypothetical protein OQL19_02295 [Gammaproteobacteria bacterium]|nr:hypothetical protein [Gammaproteobacteria bacterium]
MPEETSLNGKTGKDITSILEKLTDVRFLVLLLSIFLYLDIWMLRFGVDPTVLSLDTAFESFKKVPLFIIIIFILSYSLLMAGFFPVLRKFIGITRLWLQDSVMLENHTSDERRLSDWSLAFILLSIYNAFLGYFASTSEYMGISIYIINILQPDGPDIIIFRLSVFFLWFVCVGFALKVDDPFPDD